MAIVRQTSNIEKNSFECDAWKHNNIIVGIDEVGRGCFAGPVVAAAVILPVNAAPVFLKDSKVMTAQERAMAFEWIRKHCFYGVGIVHHRAIGQYNIWQATLIAMKKALMHALQGAPTLPSVIVTDAMPLDLSDTHFHAIPVYHFTQGESKSSSIAAASIIAKVIRDGMMAGYDQAIPGYGFTDNKGYGTAQHRTTIKKYHYSFIHRTHFVHNFLQRDYDRQLSLDMIREVDNDAEAICGSN